MHCSPADVSLLCPINIDCIMEETKVFLQRSIRKSFPFPSSYNVADGMADINDARLGTLLRPDF